ncbi:MAG: aminotransferase class I/II-fold pyridoxal phosphate-dependent enzyme [Balneolaceae bacterium]|nr:aminotransferase class I/II-fold pyridoxal phosphate-dependent enzyme [Balneolaceae bacterium]
MSLDFTNEEFEQYIHKAAAIVEELYSEKLNRNVFAGKSATEVASLFEERIPENGLDPIELLEKVRTDIVGASTMNIGPNFYGYITGGGNQIAILADMIAAALNQNNLKWHSSPVSTELENRVIKWICQFIGYPDTAMGAILDGGSTANFNALAVARKNMAPEGMSEEGMYNQKPMTIYVSEQGHSSLDKAGDMLGIGKKYLRKVKTNDRFQMDLTDLENQIRIDKNRGLYPICVVGIAGTTNTGAVDDLKGIAAIAKKHELWYHIDAAYGGPAAKVDSVRQLFDGLELADSIVIDPHKWMYIPFEAGCFIVKNREKLRRTFSTIPDYLRSEQDDDGRTDMMEYQLPLTKSFKSLKVWMTLKAYGAKRLKETIQEDMNHAKYLAELVEESEDFELLAPVPLSIVVFRYVPKGVSESKIEEINKWLLPVIEKDGRIFLTGTKVSGKTALRTCFINPRTQMKHVKNILDVIRNLGTSVVKKS